MGRLRLRQAGVKALWRFAYDRLFSPGEQNYTADLIITQRAWDGKTKKIPGFGTTGRQHCLWDTTAATPAHA
jgi:hypothetical protein